MIFGSNSRSFFDGEIVEGELGLECLLKDRMTVSVEPERDRIGACERLTDMLLLEYQIIQHDERFKFSEEFNMKRSKMIKPKRRYRLLAPAEFEIYDDKSYAAKKRYVKKRERRNKWEEKWQSIRRNLGCFKDFDQTQWEKLLNLNNEARIRYITDGIPVFFSEKNQWNMRSSGHQRIIVFKRFMSFYITDCNGNLEDPRMAIFFWMLGHEMAHKQVDIGFRLIADKWDYVREVYCDIRGIVNAGLTKNDIDYIEDVLRKRYKTHAEEYVKSKRDHPSWEQRIKYMRKGKFDESVIREIVGYGESAENLIDYYKSHYIINAFAEAEKVRANYEVQKHMLAMKDKSYHMYIDESYERIEFEP